MSKVTISSAEFEKAFSRYRDTAQHEPVTITDRGHDSLVLLSAEEYWRLKRLDRDALFAWELDAATRGAMGEAEVPAEATAFDHEFTG